MTAIALFSVVACTPEGKPQPGSLPSPSLSPPQWPDGVTAFVGVEVLPMLDGEPVLHERTVAVYDGRILDIVDAATPLPATAAVIEATGQFLMPGLIDAHVHAWYEGELTLLVANGVTATRNLFGDPLQRDWRDEIVAGERFGPALVTAGPIVDGSPPLWPTSDIVVDALDAAQVVGNQRDERYDLIKVYNNLGREGWEAVLAEAAAAGLPVDGHVPWNVGWDDVVASDQRTIEHLDGLIDVVADRQQPVSMYDPFAMAAALNTLDDGRLGAAAAAAAADGVILVPTLVVIDRFGSADEIAEWSADPNLQYVHPDILWSWSQSPALPPATLGTLDRYALTLRDFTLALHQAGARVALGTDANNAWVIPGFSLHEELRLLVEAGLTPLEALRAGTVTAAAAIGRTDMGTVAIGQRADLLLLESDPTADVAHAQARVGVMVGGEWYPEDELQGRLDELAAQYAAQRSAQRSPPGAPPLFDGCPHAR